MKKYLWKSLSRRIKRIPRVLYQHKVKRIFKSINIETNAFCNRKCSFCFNNDEYPDREEGLLTGKLWKKFIGELSEINFAGRLSPHFYGEPLLDKRLPKLIKYARRKLPFAYIRFASNGDFMTEGILLKFIKSGIEKVTITNYDDKVKPHLKELQKEYPIFVSYKNYKNIPIRNRAGKLFNQSNNPVENEPCLRPSKQLVVNWKGNVVLCCNDYYEEFVMGNIEDEKVLDIWFKGKFEKLRKMLREGKRNKVSLCNGCDFTV